MLRSRVEEFVVELGHEDAFLKAGAEVEENRQKAAAVEAVGSNTGTTHMPSHKYKQTLIK
jgi:hypothetical protein